MHACVQGAGRGVCGCVGRMCLEGGLVISFLIIRRKNFHVDNQSYCLSLPLCAKKDILMIIIVHESSIPVLLLTFTVPG